MELLKDKLFNGISFEIIREEYREGYYSPFWLFLRVTNFTATNGTQERSPNRNPKNSQSSVSTLYKEIMQILPKLLKKMSQAIPT